MIKIFLGILIGFLLHGINYAQQYPADVEMNSGILNGVKVEYARYIILVGLSNDYKDKKSYLDSVQKFLSYSNSKIDTVFGFGDELTALIRLQNKESDALKLLSFFSKSGFFRYVSLNQRV